jgi:hypothetical protein
MGHRASVAYLREDGTVQAHYSHWGAFDLRLAFGDTPISADRPFGGDDATPEFAQALFGALAEGAAEREMEVAVGHDADAGDVDTEPYWEGDDLSEWSKLDGINYLHHEAAYVVDPWPDDWQVRAFDTVWWDSPGDGSVGRGENGTLVECYDTDEWGDYSTITYADDWQDCSTFAEFLNQLRDTLAEPDRIPAFAPGGTEGGDE